MQASSIGSMCNHNLKEKKNAVPVNVYARFIEQHFNVRDKRSRSRRENVRGACTNHYWIAGKVVAQKWT